MTHEAQAAVDRAIVTVLLPELYQAISDLLAGLEIPKKREYEIRGFLPPQYAGALKKKT